MFGDRWDEERKLHREAAMSRDGGRWPGIDPELREYHRRQIERRQAELRERLDRKGAA